MKPMERAILWYITGYIKEHKYSPSVREIAQGVGLKSINSVHYHLTKMIDAGYLETDVEDIAKARALRVPGYEFVKKGVRVACGQCGEEFEMPEDKLYKLCPYCGRERK